MENVKAVAKRKKLVILFAASLLVVSGGVIWWDSVGKFLFSEECKAAKQQLAASRVDTSAVPLVYKALVNMQNERKVIQYCQ